MPPLTFLSTPFGALSACFITSAIAFSFLERASTSFLFHPNSLCRLCPAVRFVRDHGFHLPGFSWRYSMPANPGTDRNTVNIARSSSFFIKLLTSAHSFPACFFIPSIIFMASSIFFCISLLASSEPSRICSACFCIIFEAFSISF